MKQKTAAPTLAKLPYYRPQINKDYWVIENILPDPEKVWRRCLNKEDWLFGQPYRNETWPGMRSPGALLADEIAIVEARVKELTKTTKLWQVVTPEGASLSHNYVQLVGASESGPRPHTDSRKLCRFAAVIYLTPNAPRIGGTSFFRLRLPNGSLGGNTCPAPHANLREALNVTSLPIQAWQEDLAV